MAQSELPTVDRPDASVVVAAWYDQHVDVIHRYTARRVGESLARDVVADTFRVALEQFERFDGRPGGERPWLYGIASNLIRRHWRTEHRRLRSHVREAHRQTVPGDPLIAIDARLDARQRLARVMRAVAELDPDDRDLLTLIAWEGCTSAEAAEALGIPPGTVRSRLARIRTQLNTHEGEAS